MRLVARVGDQPTLIEQLQRRGTACKPIRGGATIVSLERAPGYIDAAYIYTVPVELRGYPLFIEVSESWDAADGGIATVVCGLSGKALRPFYTGRGQAVFSVPVAGIVITAWRQREGTMIEKFSVVPDDCGARIARDCFWRGWLRAGLPKRFEHYRPAITAAHEKSKCQNCQHVIFLQQEL